MNHKKYENGCLPWAFRVFRGLKSSTRLVASLLIVVQLNFTSGCVKSVKWLDKQDRSGPLMQRASARKNEGEVDSAIRLYAKALAEDPKLAMAHLDIAVLLHSYKDDYIRAIYHYQRYLELRPQTEKREMIENRIRLAKQSFAASIFHRDVNTADSIAELKKENAELKEELKRLRAEPVASNAELGPRLGGARRGLVPLRGNAELGPPSSQLRVQTYRVKRGDTLSSIAAELYGDAKKWEKIYEANRNSIASSHDLKAGQVLVIP